MENELWINEETAQLILDAIAWCNRDWMDALGGEYTESDEIGMARNDFVRFCKDRGISGVEKEVSA